MGKDQQVRLVASLCALTRFRDIKKIEQKSGIIGGGGVLFKERGEKSAYVVRNKISFVWKLESFCYSRPSATCLSGWECFFGNLFLRK